MHCFTEGSSTRPRSCHVFHKWIVPLKINTSKTEVIITLLPLQLNLSTLSAFLLSQKSSFTCSGEKSPLFQLTIHGSPIQIIPFLLWSIRCPLLFIDTISTLVWTIDSSVLSQASRVIHEQTSTCSLLDVHPPLLAIMPNAPPSNPDELFAVVQITRLSWL